MAATAVSANGPVRRSDFGAGQLFLADSRLALAALNYARLEGLRRAFGVNRADANMMTAALLLGAGPPVLAVAWGAVRAPLAVVSGVNAAAGGVLLREATRGVAGPAAGEVPFAQALLALAIVGGVALPGLRRVTHNLRQAERTLRQRREGLYSAGRAAMRGNPART